MTWLRIQLELTWNTTLTLFLTCLLAREHIRTLSLRPILDCMLTLTIKACIPQDPFAYHLNLVQQSAESFMDFLPYVTEAVERWIYADPRRDMIIKQLAWEGLHAPTCNATAAVRNDDIHKWVVATCDLDPGAVPISVLTASIDTLVMEHVQRYTLLLKGS